MPRRVKCGGWNSRLQNQSEKGWVVVILQSQTTILTRCITVSNSQQDTLHLLAVRPPLLRRCPSLSRSLSYFVLTCPLLIRTSYLTQRYIFTSLLFSSIILYHPSIAFGLLLFSVLVELGTWYAGRCNLIYHHY
ncbi:hypothetical protein ACN42_g64 [Penicillium freii]|uniref:Uncharacterized protein n=1 Tax=Penicillium freii TaxID=48697 RepID=A0A117NTC4_PENFR|nr:hypothetical protein ACN42_g64 [Penicillium freii]